MELMHLEYFKKVAEYQHMTKAAEELHISQPSLSKIIKELEIEINYNLFDRKGKYIVLNDNGIIFLRHVNAALNTLDNAIVEIAENNHKKEMTVTVNLIAAGKILPYLMVKFKKKYPEINVNIIVNTTSTTIEETECDLMVYSSLDEFDEDNSKTLYNEEILLAVPKNHRFANENSIELIKTKDENYITTEKESAFTDTLMHYCKIAGFNPKITIQANYASMIKGFVQAGLGIAILPELTWEESYDRNIAYLKINKPHCFRYIKIKWRKDDYIPKAVEIFKEFVINYFKEYQDIEHNS